MNWKNFTIYGGTESQQGILRDILTVQTDGLFSLLEAGVTGLRLNPPEETDG